jgi:hypothetical protein
MMEIDITVNIPSQITVNGRQIQSLDQLICIAKPGGFPDLADPADERKTLESI